jgi:hypothetical protein
MVAPSPVGCRLGRKIVMAKMVKGLAQTAGVLDYPAAAQLFTRSRWFCGKVPIQHWSKTEQ